MHFDFLRKTAFLSENNFIRTSSLEVEKMLQFVILSSLLACSAALVVAPLPDNIPIAMHQLVVVDTAGDSVIRLKSFDENSFDVRETTLYMLEVHNFY